MPLDIFAVYFDQLLSTAHSKRSSKYAFVTFFCAKSWKSKKFDANL